MHPHAEDHPLRGGTANFGRVFRVGDTVHRPCGPHTRSVHVVLRHLAAHGFTGAPRVIGVDRDTEIVGYIPGTAPSADPVPDWALTDDALVSVGELLRDYHTHVTGVDLRRQHWQRELPPPWRGPIITHTDLNPANVIFRDGRAVAMIDFDLAAPGTAAFDLAVAACFWAPLRDATDIQDSRRDHVLDRFRRLLDAYGANTRLRRDVAYATPAANRWIADIIHDNAMHDHPAFGLLWEHAKGMYWRASAWLASHTDELITASR